MEPDLDHLVADPPSSDLDWLSFLSNASTVPDWLGAILRDRSVIHRYVATDRRWLCQLQLIFWHQPVVRPLPGRLPQGADLPHGFAARCIGRIGEHSVLLGKPDDRPVRQVASGLHQAMIREGGYQADPMAIEADDQDRAIDNHIFLVTTADGRAIGYASTGRAIGLLLVCPGDGPRLIKPACQFRPVPARPRIIEVESVWIAPAFRRQGIAAQLIRLVARHFGVNPVDLSFRAPFTREAVALNRKVVGSVFAATGEIAMFMQPVGVSCDLFEPDAIFPVSPSAFAWAGEWAGKS